MRQNAKPKRGKRCCRTLFNPLMMIPGGGSKLGQPSPGRKWCLISKEVVVNPFFKVHPVDRKEIIVINGRPIVFEIKQNYRVRILFSPDNEWLLRVVPNNDGILIQSEDLKLWERVPPWRTSLLKTQADLLTFMVSCVCTWLFEDPGLPDDRLEFAKTDAMLLRHLSQWMYEDSYGVWPDNGDYPEAEQYAYIVATEVSK